MKKTNGGLLTEIIQKISAVRYPAEEIVQEEAGDEYSDGPQYSAHNPPLKVVLVPASPNFVSMGVYCRKIRFLLGTSFHACILVELDNSDEPHSTSVAPMEYSAL